MESEREREGVQFRMEEICIYFSKSISETYTGSRGDRQMELVIERGWWYKLSRNEKHIFVISYRHTGAPFSLLLSILPCISML